MLQKTSNSASTSDTASDDPANHHVVDIEIGKRVKKRRLQLRMSQTALGAAVGVSFQQVQKYERGSNRVSASTLYEMANVLGVQVTHFFDGLSQMPQAPDCELTRKAIAREEFVATDEGQRLVDAFLTIPKKMRPKFISLLATFSSDI